MPRARIARTAKSAMNSGFQGSSTAFSAPLVLCERTNPPPYFTSFQLL